MLLFFVFNDTATTEIYTYGHTLSLHDALPIFRTLQQETGTALIMITHDLGVVAEIAGRVAVKYAGHIVEAGPVEAIFDDPQHPYTIGLMSSVPSVGGRNGRLAARSEEPTSELQSLMRLSYAVFCLHKKKTK